MAEITTYGILEVITNSVLRHWVLIVGFIGTIVTGLKYLSNRSKQHQKSIDLLESLAKTSESMDGTMKEVREDFNRFETDFKLLRQDHNRLYKDHKDLEKKVDKIERGK